VAARMRAPHSSQEGLARGETCAPVPGFFSERDAVMQNDDQRLPDADRNEPWMFEAPDPSAGSAAVWVMACIVFAVVGAFCTMAVLA
jgi:hypothetical protein